MKHMMIAAIVVFAGCRTVVVESTSEVRPSRYAAVEFTRPLASQDSAIAYIRRALAAEQLKVQTAEQSVITAGPARFAAEGEHPALEATITINAVTAGGETTFRIIASSLVAQNVVGGVDARLTALTQRLRQHIEQMIAR